MLEFDNVDFLLGSSIYALRAILVFAFGISGLLKRTSDLPEHFIEGIALGNFGPDVLKGERFGSVCIDFLSHVPDLLKTPRKDYRPKMYLKNAFLLNVKEYELRKVRKNDT